MDTKIHEILCDFEKVVKASSYSNEAEILLRAARESARAHYEVGQVRESSGLPYIVHPIEAAEISMGFQLDIHTVLACLGHDSLENTNMSMSQAIDIFGTVAAFVINEVTDYDDMRLPRKVRKDNTRIRLSQASSRGQNVKLADICSNARDIIHAKASFAGLWLEEKNQLIACLNNAHEPLKALAQERVTLALEQLKERCPS